MNVGLKQKEGLFHDFCCWFDVYSHSRILCTIPEMKRKCASLISKLGHTIANLWRGDLNTSMNVGLKQKTSESEDLRRGFSNLRRTTSLWRKGWSRCLDTHSRMFPSPTHFQGQIRIVFMTYKQREDTKCTQNDAAIWFPSSTWKSLWQFWVVPDQILRFRAKTMVWGR